MLLTDRSTKWTKRHRRTWKHNLLDGANNRSYELQCSD